MDESSPLLARISSVDSSKISADGSKMIPTHANRRTDFDPAGDPDNPLEWKPAYKWGLVLLQAFIAFTVTFTCISVVPVASHIIKDISGGESSKSASVLLVTIWELGEAAGPLLIAPLSEVYGRYPIYNAANILFIMGIVITALSESVGLLIFARFLTGCAVASNVLNPAIIGDIFVPEQRGSAMSIVMLAPLLGGAIGPAIAGAVAQSSGWRQIVWMSLILASSCELLFFTLFPETYKVTLLRRKANRTCIDSTGGLALASASILKDVGETESAVLIAIARPAKVFASSFVLQVLSLYGSVMFSIFYVLSTSLPDILQTKYDFPPALVGTTFISFSVGSICSIIICNTLIDRIYKHLQRQGEEDEHRPENRLPLVIAGAFTLPLLVGLYGWIAERHWPVELLILCVGLQGMACILAIVPMMSYVVDAFGLYSASALTAVLISRCLMGTFLPLVAAPLAQMLGYGLGYTIVGAFCFALAPIPAVVMRYGGTWRQYSKYTKAQ